MSYVLDKAAGAYLRFVSYSGIKVR